MKEMHEIGLKGEKHWSKLPFRVERSMSFSNQVTS